MDSHRLIYFVVQQGSDKQHHLVEDLFLGYFTQGEYIEDLEDVEVDQFDLNGRIEEDLNEVEEREPINLNDLDIPNCVDELVGEGVEEDIAVDDFNLNDSI
ncbi:hypothetical protein K1719_022716 [Acacia pycnantha]|nr:hypothetical protein K1719_022716 [Acacia pycnantha]